MGQLKPKYIKHSNTLYTLPKLSKPTEFHGDVDTMMAYFRAKPKAVYVLESLFGSRGGPRPCSQRTAVSAIKKGYRDLCGWTMVNCIHMVNERYYEDGQIRYRNQLVDDKSRGNVVFDFDKVPGVDTIEGMQELLLKKGLPGSPYILHTSFNSFHVYYNGEYGYWSRERKLEYAFKFIGRNNKEKIEEADITALKKAGIDYSYLIQDTSMCKMRLPGSARSTLWGIWVCNGKYFPEYDDSQVAPKEESKVEASIEVERIKAPKKKAPKNQDYYSTHFEKVLKIIEPYMSKKHSKKMAEFITQRLGFLTKGNCKIAQKQLAELIGTTQPTISRVLRAMVVGGVLEVKNDGFYRYVKGATGIPKTYGIGQQLRDIITVTDEKLVRKQLAEPYQEGEANAALLKDIGVMYKCGFSDDDIVRICSKKMEARGSRKKTDNMLRRAVARWEERGDRLMQRPPTPIIDPNSILIIAGSG